MKSALISLQVVSGIHGINFDILSTIRKNSLTDETLSVESFTRIARESGFKTKKIKIKQALTKKDFPFPLIIRD